MGMDVDNNEVSEGLGSMPGQYPIELQQDAVAVIYAHREIPLSLDKLINTLSQMESSGVVKVDHATDWVNSLVIVKMYSGK